MIPFKACSVAGCASNADSHAQGVKGLCKKHYMRLRTNGMLTPKTTERSDIAPALEKAVGHDGHECLIWPYSRDPNGYGRLGDGRTVSRVVCEMIHGPAPSPTHQAAHSCGNGHLGCVSGGHLRWATPLENARDRAIHGTAKLKQEDVDIIVSLKGTESQTLTASRFGVCQTTISRLQRLYAS